MSGEIPCATPDTQSVRTTSGPLGPSEKFHSVPYTDPRQPGKKFNQGYASNQLFFGYCGFAGDNDILFTAVPVRIVDPSKDLNSYGLGNVDWKERVEGWKLKQEKNIAQPTGRYIEGKGDIEGTGSNGDELQM